MNPLIVLLTGMLIVFIGLICIVLIVKLMTLICSLFIGKKKSDATANANKHSSASSEGFISAPLSREERSKLIVAISAAIGEMTGMDNIRITSIKRLGSVNGAQHDRREVIAAMSAAIAQASDLSTDSFRITSIKKLS